jgi:hypothetical protein
MAIINGVAKSADAGGFYPKEIEQSLRFNDNDSAYLSWTPASAGNRKTWTWSGWVKRGNLGTQQTFIAAGSSQVLKFNSSDQISYSVSGVNSNVTTAVFRDPSAWYHVVFAFDTTEASANDRGKLWVNGEFYSWSGTFFEALDTTRPINNATLHTLGARSDLTNYLDGYLSEVHFTDGTAYDATAFGEFKNGVWVAKNPDVTYGTNGFYLAFDGDVTDSSGNGNDWTANNLASTDYMLDSPTNNFCTISPYLYRWATTKPVLSEGNLKVDPGSNLTSYVVGDVGVTSGKWYYEGMVDAVAATAIGFGFGNEKLADVDRTDSIFYRRGSTGTIESANVAVDTGVGDITAFDIIGVYLDLDAGEISFYKNNSIVGSSPYALPTTGINLLPAVLQANANNFYLNFGQDSSFAGNVTPQGYTDANGIGDFYYAPPTGALALCTANLPEPVIGPNSDSTSDENFNTVLYTGNGSTQSINGLDFQPDMVWVKERSSTSWHQIVDVVRGTEARLQPNDTAVESSVLGVTAFNSDGFDVGSSGAYNENSQTYVAWNWKADNTSGSSNTDGSITSTVSANTDAGFSIVSWSGNNNVETIGHGLNQAPELIIRKSRSTAQAWVVTGSTLGSQKYIYLNVTNAAATYAPIADPTDTVFNGWGVDSNSTSMIAYCFHSVEGFSKFGSYTGNGSTDGPFVYTGFRPAFVMVKRTDAAEAWSMLDAERDPFNQVDETIYASDSSAESTESTVARDYLSNGFKLRGTWAGMNASGGTYIYMAFAENPFKYSNAR